MNKTQVGQQVGPYRLTRLLGAGGFGEVYEADHQLLQQKRAIKLLLERHFYDHTSVTSLSLASCAITNYAVCVTPV